MSDLSFELCLFMQHRSSGSTLTSASTSTVTLCFFSPPGPPQVADQVAHRQSARLGSAIKLPCPVNGDPPPLIMWTKDGRNIHSGWTRFRILRLGLKIKEVEAEDAGTYVCKATNGFGSVNINYTLIVIGKKPAQCLPLNAVPPGT